MASQGVALDPWQNIVSVGWNAGPFLWLNVAFEIGIPGFGFQLIAPAIADYDDRTATTTAFGWPDLLPPDYTKFKTKFVYFSEVANTEAGGTIGAGVYFVNIGLIYKEHAVDFDGGDPLTFKLFSGFGADPGDPSSPPGLAKVRAFIFKPKSTEQIGFFWQPDPTITTAATLDAVLDKLELVGGEQAGRRGDDPWFDERLYNVPSIPPNTDFTWGTWSWDYRKRSDAIVYPPAGADPVLS
jgi:hypothetical protein